MTSSKGQPTDPELKEQVTEEVKQQPNKDGSGKGQMAAWKAAKIGKEYEARGGDYENEAGSKNEPKKGPPEKKSETQKKDEVADADKNAVEGDEAAVTDKTTEPKARGRPKATTGVAKKKKAESSRGPRVSDRLQDAEKKDRKRKAAGDSDGAPTTSRKTARTGLARKVKPATGAKRGRPAASATKATNAKAPAGGEAKKRGRPAGSKSKK